MMVYSQTVEYQFDVCCSRVRNCEFVGFQVGLDFHESLFILTIPVQALKMRELSFCVPVLK